MSFWNLPAGQTSQAGLPATAVYVPAAQDVGAVEPVVQKEPASHGVHQSAVTRVVKGEYEPAGHGSAAAAPRRQYLPGSQGLHAVLPSSSWNFPASHLVHDAAPPALYVPAPHGVAAVEPTGQ